MRIFSIWQCFYISIVCSHSHFFNNIPITDFEVFIDTYLIKGNRVYSHIYSFQSEVISNLSMIIAPLFAIYTCIDFKAYLFI